MKYDFKERNLNPQEYQIAYLSHCLPSKIFAYTNL